MCSMVANIMNPVHGIPSVHTPTLSFSAVQHQSHRSNTDGMEVRSVGNSQALKETALIEAFNLKAAIEYVMKNMEGAKEALTDMPPRSEEELDPVSVC